MPPPLFQPCTINSPFDGTKYNANMAEAENSFADLGPYVITGVTVTIGTGLSVNVASGTVSIGGRVTVASTTIAGLTDNTTNHLYILNTGGGTSNTTGTAPANSVKLGTAVTAGGVVTTVAMGRTSGRQQFQQPQNLVLGGPSAGTASAGHPRAGNLAQWNTTQAEGFEFFGTLPAGALPSAFTAPATFQVTDAGTTNEPTIMTWQHRTSGTPAASFGNTVLFRADNASNALADQLSVATGWSTATAGAESSLAIYSIRRAGVNTEVMRLNSVGNGQLRASADFAHTGTAAGFFNATPITQPVNTTDLRTAIINLGFLASGGATPLNLNGGTLTAATITGDCLNAVTLLPGTSTRNLVQPSVDVAALILKASAAGQTNPPLSVQNQAGTEKLALYANQLPGASASSGSGYRLTVGTYAAALVNESDALFSCGINTAQVGTQVTTDQGAMFRMDTRAGQPVFSVLIYDTSALTTRMSVHRAGYVTLGRFDTASPYGTVDIRNTDNALPTLVLTAFPSPAFPLLTLQGRSSTGTDRQQGALDGAWLLNTDATRQGRVILSATDFNATREGLRVEADGTNPRIGFLGAAAVVRQTAAAAATDLATVITLANSLRTGLIADGLFA